MMAQDDVGDAGEIDPQLAGVLQDGLGPLARVEQEPSAVDLHQRGEAPFADSRVIGEHGGEDRHAKRASLVRQGIGGRAGKSGQQQEGVQGAHGDLRQRQVEAN
jgi:hypothetical protein